MLSWSRPWVAVLSLTLILGQVNSFTFTNPGKSYIEYRPIWPTGDSARIEFTFRTYKSNTFLLHFTFAKNLLGDEGTRPEAEVRLRRGELEVTHSYMDFTESITVAKGLNHDRWHTVVLTLDTVASTLTVDVDTRGAKTLQLSAYSEGGAKEALGEGPQSSIVSVGGYSPQAFAEPSLFVGCIKDVQFFNGDDEIPAEVNEQSDVEDGCQNKCLPGSCLNGGRCINQYTETSCDCFKTGYEGETCNVKGLTSISLEGTEWLSYKVYDMMEDRTHSPANRISLQFKTEATEGVLFYAREKYPQYNHVAVSLYNASLHVSVVFVDQVNYDELYITMGSGLDDDIFHSVTIVHDGQDVTVTLDQESGKMNVNHVHPHLHVPPTVYIGGMDLTSQNLGLKTQSNFVGCLRGIYFNNMNVIEQISTERAQVENGDVNYGCHSLQATSLQFTHNGAFAKVEHESSAKIDLQLYFRTLKQDGVLIHTLLTSGNSKGYAELSLSEGSLVFKIVPSLYHKKDISSVTLQGSFGDNEWHIVKASAQQSVLYLSVGEEFAVGSYHAHILAQKETYVGFGPETEMFSGFVGCMKNVNIQGRVLNPVQVVTSDVTAGITLGSCDMVDNCLSVDKDNQCLHGGVCVSEWSETYCDCRYTDFEGRRCQFSKLKKSCHEYFQDGRSLSGVYRIDVDGTGPLGPNEVFCAMGEKIDGKLYGLTRVHHNLQNETPVRDEVELYDMRKMVKYRGMGSKQLAGLVGIAQSCNQYVHYNCYRAPLNLGQATYFKSASGKEFYSFGSDRRRSCGCYDHDTCIDDRYPCNCDQKSSRWLSDDGYMRRVSHIPVTEMTFYQEGGKGNVTMGPLECIGSRKEGRDSTITFVSSESVLKLEQWNGGEIEFSFRTTYDEGVILYQPAPPGVEDSNHHLLLKFSEGEKIYLEMAELPSPVTVTSRNPLNAGDWHHIVIETNMQQVRVTVDKQRFIFDLDINQREKRGAKWVTNNDPLKTYLYIGGIPLAPKGSTSGYIGCFKGLYYNGEARELNSIVDRCPSGVLNGCTTHCESNPCVNGAKCIEQWTSYVCECENAYAHFGKNCEINMNEISISFDEESAMLYYERPQEVMTQDVILSFRTQQKNALLFYMYDLYNNFIQVEVKDYNSLVVSYNNVRDIEQTTMFSADLTDGSWKQVAILVQGGTIQVALDDNKSLEKIRNVLLRYTQDPFSVDGDGSGAVQQNLESVVPERGPKTTTAGAKIFIGAVTEDMTDLSGLKGCLRGLKIGDEVIQLRQSAQGRDNIKPYCSSGCSHNQCENGGRCVDNPSFSGAFTCECSATGYAGPLCNIEVGVSLGGSTRISQGIPTKSLDHRGIGRSQSLRFNFATGSISPTKRAIVFARGAESDSDYMMVYLSESGTLVADLTVNKERLTLESALNYENGRSHRVELLRKDWKVMFKVDRTEIPGDLTNAAEQDPVSIITVGGVKSDNPAFADFGNYSGDISNVFLVSDQLAKPNARPLDAFHNYELDPEPLTVDGVVEDVTRSLSGSIERHTREFEGPKPFEETDEEIVKELTEWEIHPAVTINLEGTTHAEEVKDEPIVPAWLGVIICLCVLAVIGVALGIIIYRHTKKGGGYTVPQPIDEEEELLEEKPTPVKEPIKSDDNVPMIKLKRGPKPGDKKAEDDDNEETPMLTSEQPTDETQPEPSKYQKIVDQIEFENEIPVSSSALPTTFDVDITPQTEVESTKPQADLEVAPTDTKPTDTKPDAPVTEVSPVSKPLKEEAPSEKESTPSETSTPSLNVPVEFREREDSYSKTPREALTESQVIEILDQVEQEDDEETPQSDGESPAVPRPTDNILRQRASQSACESTADSDYLVDDDSSPTKQEVTVDVHSPSPLAKEAPSGLPQEAESVTSAQDEVPVQESVNEEALSQPQTEPVSETPPQDDSTAKPTPIQDTQSASNAEVPSQPNQESVSDTSVLENSDEVPKVTEPDDVDNKPADEKLPVEEVSADTKSEPVDVVVEEADDIKAPEPETPVSPVIKDITYQFEDNTTPGANNTHSDNDTKETPADDNKSDNKNVVGGVNGAEAPVVAKDDGPVSAEEDEGVNGNAEETKETDLDAEYERKKSADGIVTTESANGEAGSKKSGKKKRNRKSKFNK